MVLLVLFVFWEHFLEKLHTQHDVARERWWTPPPLMSVTIWTRAHGKLAVVLAIAFLEWCSFNSFAFWIQVRRGLTSSSRNTDRHVSLQLYYQDYVGLSPILTMVRLLPMCVTGVLCNVVVAIIVGHVPLVWMIATGTLFTGLANLLFAVVDPAAPYWAFGFPAAIVSVFGADFVFATGTLFVAKVCLPHEQSVGGALFQTLTQVGTAFGLAISTIVFNATIEKKAHALGVDTGALASASAAPRSAQLAAYKNAMWAGCAFGFFGGILGFIFLRSVGVVGHRKEKEKDHSDRESVTPDSDAASHA